MGSSFQIAVGPDVRASSSSTDGMIAILIKSFSFSTSGFPSRQQSLFESICQTLTFCILQTLIILKEKKNNILKHLIGKCS